jgi:hypothetical protein
MPAVQSLEKCEASGNNGLYLIAKDEVPLFHLNSFADGEVLHDAEGGQAVEGIDDPAQPCAGSMSEPLRRFKLVYDGELLGS